MSPEEALENGKKRLAALTSELDTIDRDGVPATSMSAWMALNELLRCTDQFRCTGVKVLVLWTGLRTFTVNLCLISKVSPLHLLWVQRLAGVDRHKKGPWKCCQNR